MTYLRMVSKLPPVSGLICVNITSHNVYYVKSDIVVQGSHAQYIILIIILL